MTCIDNSNFFKNDLNDYDITKGALQLMVNNTLTGEHNDDGQETILIGMNKDFDCSRGGGTEFTKF